MTESRKTLENLVRELRESGASTDKTKDVKAFLAEFAESVDKQYGVLEREEREALAEGEGADGAGARSGARPGQGKGAGSAGSKGGAPAAAPARLVLAEGAEVLYGPSRRRARIIRQASAGKWVIEIGSLKLTVPAGDLSAAEETAAERPAYDVELAPRGAEGSARASFELDLRGFRLAEALEAVERQVDAASLQGLNLFSIIHGTGGGRPRQGHPRLSALERRRGGLPLRQAGGGRLRQDHCSAKGIVDSELAAMLSFCVIVEY